MNIRKTIRIVFTTTLGLILASLFAFRCTQSPLVKVKKNAHIIMVGNNLGARMMDYGYFETEIHLRYPDSLLYIRNMCDAGNTPGFRPHSGRPSPWAFPGAEKFQTELATSPNSQGFYETPDEWITRHKADIIIAFFGIMNLSRDKKALKTIRLSLMHSSNTH